MNVGIALPKKLPGILDFYVGWQFFIQAQQFLTDYK